ncbi:MAG: histidinol dehydrogenase [Bacteroidota bacterium]
MKGVKYPEIEDWATLCERPTFDFSKLEGAVTAIMDKVRNKGDQALRHFAHQFDGVELASISFNLAEAAFEIDPDLAKAIKQAKANIEQFHLAQKENFDTIETMPGVQCWRKSLPIQHVGLYIPGGTAPLFSTLLMLAIPAKIAGCENIVVCTPPQKEEVLNDVIGWTCQLLGIEKVYLTGGAQAVAAMTFGTESVPKVDKIFGPGNQYVTAAKQLAQRFGVAIDMPAGPSEVLVIADDAAEPEFVAADLLSQAEHGVDSQVVLVSDSEQLIAGVNEEVIKQLNTLPRQEIAAKALENSQSILVNDLKEAVAFSNMYAPEHLIIATKNSDELAEQITIAGSVFIGNWSCESAGDYASGTNHTLPTNGYARNYSGVSLDSFIKKITFQKLSEEGIKNLGPAIEKMAAAEQLQAHKNAVSVRLKKVKGLPLTPSKGGNNSAQSTSNSPSMRGPGGGK